MAVYDAHHAGDAAKESDTTFPPLDELLTAPRNNAAVILACQILLIFKVSRRSQARADKNTNAIPCISGDSDANEPSVTSGADPDNESVSTQYQ